MEREVKDWVEEEGDEYSLQILLLCSLLAQRVKRLTTMQETWVRYLGGEDPLEKVLLPGKSHGRRSMQPLIHLTGKGIFIYIYFFFSNFLVVLLF